MFWSLHKIQCVLALVDTGTECILLCGNPDRFDGLQTHIDRYGRYTVHVKQAMVVLGIGHLPSQDYTVYISAIPEYILGMDILQRLTLRTTQGEF